MVWRRGSLWLVMVALVAAQTLGLLHSLVHPPAATGGHLHGWVEKFFADHADDADCRLYDQLSHSDGAPGVPLLALPALPPAFIFQFFQGEAVARWAALFDARGPPSVR
ncbi:MAG: hypothetical protein AB7I35_10240 [Ramlibacter sp.]